MSTTKLFEKHFGKDAIVVDVKHPKMEKFLNELNKECLAEDRQKQKSDTVKQCT
jgi:hypothetical protein